MNIETFRNKVCAHLKFEEKKMYKFSWEMLSTTTIDLNYTPQTHKYIRTLIFMKNTGNFMSKK